MSLDAYRAALQEQYQGEVAGEASISRMLKQFTSLRQQYLLGSMLQLETETKARLRPAAASLGIDLVESEDARAEGEALAELAKGLDWQAANKALEGPLADFTQRYREIAAIAPPEFKELAESMVTHEESLLQVARSEASGKNDDAISAVVDQLVFPLPRPEP
jgi:tryptophan 2,3-dioxygenase